MKDTETKVPDRIKTGIQNLADAGVEDLTTVEELGRGFGHTHGQYGAEVLFPLIKSMYEQFVEDDGDDGEVLLKQLTNYFNAETKHVKEELGE